MTGGGPRGRPGPGCLALVASGTAQQWSNVPNLLGAIFGASRRVPADLTRVRQFRVVAAVTVGCPSAYLRARYGLTASDALSPLGASGDLLIAGTGNLVGDWADIAAGARGQRYVTVGGGGSDGDGTASFLYIGLEFR